MRAFEDDAYFNEKIRQLAVEQMAKGVISIVLTRRADGGIEVAIAREMTDLGRPAPGYVDRGGWSAIERLGGHLPEMLASR